MIRVLTNRILQQMALSATNDEIFFLHSESRKSRFRDTRMRMRNEIRIIMINKLRIAFYFDESRAASQQSADILNGSDDGSFSAKSVDRHNAVWAVVLDGRAVQCS